MRIEISGIKMPQRETKVLKQALEREEYALAELVETNGIEAIQTEAKNNPEQSYLRDRRKHCLVFRC